MATLQPTVAAAKLPRPGVRAAVSVLILLHVFGVFVGPWAMPPQNSELGMSIARVYQPYLDVFNLANGYRFFAPEPGPSHLVRYEVTLDDGTKREGVFPDRDVQKPRLLYHRYFMLSEFLNTLENAGRSKEPAEAYGRSYAQHLAEQDNAKTVKLYLRRHYIPRMNEVRAGMQLTDKKLYEERLLVTYERDEP